MSGQLIYVVSGVRESRVFEWTALHLRQRYRLTFVLLISESSPLERSLSDMEVEAIRLTYRSRWDLPAACWRLLQILRARRPERVHCHLLEAQLVGLLAATFSGVRQRIYTRHNSTLHHTYHRKGLLYDSLSNRLATHIVSLSPATEHALRIIDRVPSRKIRRIPHGFDFAYFNVVDSERTASVRRRWEIPEVGPVVGVVSRFIEWKGIQYIIPAFREFVGQVPSACLVLANANGPFHSELSRLLQDLPASSYRLIPFEPDSASLYKCFDLFVHVPADPYIEAFGQVYIEAMAAGIPCILTPSGIAAEVARHGENAWVVPFHSASAIAGALHGLWSNEEMRIKLSASARQAARPFTVEKMIEGLCSMYDE